MGNKPKINITPKKYFLMVLVQFRDYFITVMWQKYIFKVKSELDCFARSPISAIPKVLINACKTDILDVFGYERNRTSSNKNIFVCLFFINAHFPLKSPLLLYLYFPLGRSLAFKLKLFVNYQYTHRNQKT